MYVLYVRIRYIYILPHLCAMQYFHINCMLKPSRREKQLQWTITKQCEKLAVETPEERELRLECYSTTVCAATTPTASTVLHAPLVQKDFLASISTQSLINVCVVAVTVHSDVILLYQQHKPWPYSNSTASW